VVVGGRWYSTVGGDGGLVVFLMLNFLFGCGMAWLGGDFGWLGVLGVDDKGVADWVRCVVRIWLLSSAV